MAEGGTSSPYLLQVELETRSGTQCRQIYGSDYIETTMVCAGPLEGGEDACQVKTFSAVSRCCYDS